MKFIQLVLELFAVEAEHVKFIIAILLEVLVVFQMSAANVRDEPYLLVDLLLQTNYTLISHLTSVTGITTF